MYVPPCHKSEVFLAVEIVVLSRDKTRVNLFTSQIKTSWNGSLGS